jgi:hypothetical protein
MIGQLNASVPVFLVSKYKIVSKFMRTLWGWNGNATQTKEDIALRVIDYYAGLSSKQRKQVNNK